MESMMTNHPTRQSVSILLAVRNEEACILTCLAAIDKLDYPKDLYEVLIGNDDSTDRSGEFIKGFIKEKENFQLIEIQQDNPKTKGKANVLAQLAEKARGEFYFFTDADTQVPKTWLRGMLKEFDTQTGIIVGVTSLHSSTFFGTLQGVDWLFVISLIKLISDKGIAVTALGNNMAVRKKTYQQTGGYHKIAFSITEDFALFTKIIAQGWGFKQLLNKEVLAFSQAQNSLLAWLEQRKRWMRGALQSKWYLQILLYLYVLLFPVLLLSAWLFPIPVLLIWLFKIILQTLFIYKKSKELNLKLRLAPLLLYEFYVVSLYPLLFVYYFLPIKISWKGRVYK
jgi:cellulose synthase/poly-beta-1,6-N-acetylglucosamine synthase-like glycosyltransferase